MKRKTWFNGSTIFVLTTLLALTGRAWADDNKEDKKGNADKNDKQSQQKEKEKERDQPRVLQAFDLEHRNATEMQKILTLWWQSSQMGGRAATPLPATPQQQRTAGFRPQANQPNNQLAFAVDDESRVLFVRGPEDKVKDAEKIVKALDVSKDSLKKETFGNTRIIPINKDDATRVRTVFDQLQLKHQLVDMEEFAVVMICHGDSEKEKKHAEQVEEVLSKLDIDASSSSEKDDGNGENKGENDN